VVGTSRYKCVGTSGWYKWSAQVEWKNGEEEGGKASKHKVIVLFFCTITALLSLWLCFFSPPKVDNKKEYGIKIKLK